MKTEHKEIKSCLHVITKQQFNKQPKGGTFNGIVNLGTDSA